MDKILITGGLGSIGKNLIQQINKTKKAQFLIIDNLSAQNTYNINTGIDDNVNLIIGDINNREKILPIIKEFNPNYVFHLAAHFANQNSVDYPFSDLETNVGGTINILNAVKELEDFKHFVYASSSCVYGNTTEFMSTNSNIYAHETPYAINKFAAELYTCYYNHLFKIPTVSIRIFNTYGPGERAGKYRNVIPNFIFNALHDIDITITGDGSETRDFTYVGDTCDLLINAAYRTDNEYKIYNGGTGQSVKIIDLAQMIIELTNSNSKIIFKERRNWDLVKDRKSDITNSKTDLNYNPQTDLKQGLLETIKWYKTQL